MMRLAALMLLLASAVHANFLAEPLVSWSYTLPIDENGSTRSLLQGNAVVASLDGRLLFITTEDASLFILGTGDGLPIADAYQPPLIEDVLTTCKSGVALADDVYGVDYAVYAVIDSPDTSIQNNPFGELPQSRIIAINSDGTLRWNLTIDGVVDGTPGIGKDGIYVSHNVPNTVPDGEAYYSGKLTVLRDNGQDGTAPTLVTQTASPGGRSGPFGPLTVQTVTSAGNLTRDAVFVAESWVSTLNEGYVYYLDSESSLDSKGGNYELKALSDWGVSSITRPAVSPNGTMLWMGGAGSRIAGWVGDSSVDSIVASGPQQPDWDATFVSSQNGERLPIPVAPLLSTDGSLLFVAGTGDEMLGLNPMTGGLVWVHNVVSRFMCEPKFRNPDGQSGVLYTISRRAGDIRQIDAQNGERIWKFDCGDLTGNDNCADAVEAEFSVSSSNNALYYGDVFGKIVALQVGTFDTAAPALPPTLSPTVVPTLAQSMELSSATPTSDEMVAARPPSVPREVDTTQTQTQTSLRREKAVMVAVYAVAAIVGFVAIAILVFIFISYSRNKREKNDSTHPFAIHDPKDPSADTAIPAELRYEPAPCTRMSPRRKKKPTGSRCSTPEGSPSRLAAIAESPDDFFEENGCVGEGFEVIHDVAGEQRDIENHNFGNKGTTPDTSFTISSASGDYSSSCFDEDKSVSSRGSDDSDYVHGGALVPIVSDDSRPYYMIDTRPGAAGSIVRVSDGQHQNLENDIPRIYLARSDGTMTPVSAEDDKQVTENSALVPVTHEQERSVYMMQISSNNDFSPINRTPSDGTTSPVYIEDDKPCEGQEAIVPVLQRPVYAIHMTPGKSIPHISKTRSDDTTSPMYIEDDERGGGRGEMNSDHLGNEQSRSSRSEATSSLVYMEDDVQLAGYGAVVPVSDGNRRSVYAVKAPPIFMPFVPLSHRTQSDATNTSVQIKEEKQIGVPGAKVPVNCNQTRSANGMESFARSHAVQMEKLRSARLEGTSSPTSRYTTETKEYLHKPQSAQSEGTLSPTSIYTKETKEAFKSAEAPENPEHGRSVHALKSASTNSSFLLIQSVRSEGTISPKSIYKSETKETVKSAKAPEYFERGRSVYALKSPSTNSIISSQIADASTRPAEPPRYELNEQLAPSTSAYIDDDGSVEMVSDDEPAPLDEKAARRSSPRWSVAPVSVKLDACNRPPTQPASPRMDRSLPSIGSDRGGFSKRSPPNPPVSIESNPKVSEEAKSTSTTTEVSRIVSKYRVNTDSSRHDSPRKHLSYTLMGSDRGGFSTVTPERSSIQKAVEESNLTLTKTEVSRLKTQPRVDTAIPPRLMRNMRLPRTVQERKTEDPSVHGWKARGPSGSEVDSSEYESSDSIERHVIPKKAERTKSVAQSSPESILLTCSESESTEEEGKNETSRISEKSWSAPKTSPSLPLNTNTQMTWGQKSQTAPETSSSRPLNKKAKTNKRQEKSLKALVYSSPHPSFTESQEQETTAPESLVSSVFTGLFSKVEEVDRIFFNPMLSPPQMAKTKKATTKRNDAPLLDITVVRSDDESLPPPPRSPRETARFSPQETARFSPRETARFSPRETARFSPRETARFLT